MFTKKLILVCCLSSFLIEGALAQINLVKNPSFENLSTCPTTLTLLHDALNWHTPINGGGGTPDLLNSCAANWVVSVPSNFQNNGYQYPHSGNGYAGLLVAQSGNSIKEYMQGELIDTLIGGKTYCVTFYANLINLSRAYIKSLGAYLDNGSIICPGSGAYAPYTPQVVNSTQPLYDTVNWMKIEGSFTATGNESYITIGDFFPDSVSGIGIIGSPPSWQSYYYIDDISVIDVSTPAFAGKDTLIHLGDSVFVGRPPEVGLNEDCIWYVNNVAIDTVAGMWVKPIVPTTYVLKQTICGTTRYDSVRVNIEGVGINQLKSDKYITISPNPFTSQTTISFSEIQKNTTIIIMDVVGKEIKAVVFSGKSLILEKGTMQSGVYFVQITDSNKNVVNRKVVVE